MKENLNLNNQLNLFERSKLRNKSLYNKYKAIDLFAGIGGLRLGFEKFGCKFVFASEWDKHAQMTYEVNYNDKPYGDITKIEAKDIPEFDILLAGFPCQPFSQAGLKKGLADTRGTLFFDVARIIDYHRPKVVLLENVKRFKTHDNGKTFQVVKDILEGMGYTVYASILNARDFGLPQNRERIFIVGFYGKIDFTFPTPPKTKTKLSDILESHFDEKYVLSDALWEGHKRRKEEHIKKGNGFGYSLFNRDSPYTSTISARYYKDGSEILIEQKNSNPRKLTPREAARLQGFPEYFILPKSDTQAYKQFGNSVAVPVVSAIAQEILLTLEDMIETNKKHNKINLNKIKKQKINEAIKLTKK